MNTQSGSAFLGCLAVLMVLAFIGNAVWVSAHRTIAVECERLGAFYVGDKVFTCQEKAK